MMDYCCTVANGLHEKLAANASDEAITLEVCWTRYFAIEGAFIEHDKSSECS